MRFEEELHLLFLGKSPPRRAIVRPSKVISGFLSARQKVNSIFGETGLKESRSRTMERRIQCGRRLDQELNRLVILCFNNSMKGEQSDPSLQLSTERRLLTLEPQSSSLTVNWKERRDRVVVLTSDDHETLMFTLMTVKLISIASRNFLFTCSSNMKDFYRHLLNGILSIEDDGAGNTCKGGSLHSFTASFITENRTNGLPCLKNDN